MNVGICIYWIGDAAGNLNPTVLNTLPTPTTPFTNLDLNDCTDKMARLLGSQQAFLSFPTPQQVSKTNTVFIKVDCGGWSCGKSAIGIWNGLILSALFPKNQGLIGRYHGKDLEDSIIPLFFELCPESWIRQVSMRGRTGMNVLFKNGSSIFFRHIHDPGGAGATKTRRVGANLGWFFISQIEEMEEAHWNSMEGRLRNPRALIKMGMGDANPNGRNWVQRKFFPNYVPLSDGSDGVFFRTYQKGNMFGVHVNSEENRISNGGFVDDDFYNNIVENSPADWVERYIRGSMEDFTGKVYKEFNLESVHNIEPFPIPRHWECIQGIDPGGSCPWSVLPVYVDDRGNLIVTEGYDKATARTGEVASWIKSFTPWQENRTRYVIDHENKAVISDLSDHGIICFPAAKGSGSVLAGILKVGDYMHLRRGQTNTPLEREAMIPEWFKKTQPQEAIDRLKHQGVPHVFVFRTNETFRQEHDGYIWDEKKPNEPKKTALKRFNSCDAFRYVAELRPLASNLPQEDKHAALRAQDPYSASEAESCDREIAAIIEEQKGNNSREACYDLEVVHETQGRRGKYDWAN